MDFEPDSRNFGSTVDSFPSPFGVMDFELLLSFILVLIQQRGFPSPFGVMDFELEKLKGLFRGFADGFRPLSG